MKKNSLLFLLVMILLLSGAAQTQSGASAGATNSARQKLKEYVAALQANPNDYELQQKIVKLAATLKPPPVIPEEARRYYVKAVAIQKDAKTPEEAALAVSAYKQALFLAPWWADAYYNMSSALRLAGRYPEAVWALTLYLASNPKDARAVQDRIYGIEGE
jgi:tetratricopeptide (TPR) repeat protein